MDIKHAQTRQEVLQDHRMVHSLDEIQGCNCCLAHPYCYLQ